MSPLTQGLNYRSACDRVEKPELLLDVDVNGSRKTGILCLGYIVKRWWELETDRQHLTTSTSDFLTYGSYVSGGILSRRVHRSWPVVTFCEPYRDPSPESRVPWSLSVTGRWCRWCRGRQSIGSTDFRSRWSLGESQLSPFWGQYHVLFCYILFSCKNFGNFVSLISFPKLLYI